MLAESEPKDAPPMHGPSPGGGADDAWAEQYKRESGMHSVGAFLAFRAELMVLLDELPALVRAHSVLCLACTEKTGQRLLTCVPFDVSPI